MALQYNVITGVFSIGEF